MSNTRKKAEWFQPNAPPLTKEEEEAAYQGQIYYPRIVRKRIDPPISGQEYCNLSFVFLPEPKDGVWGFVKVRGVWPTKDVASDKAEDIIREVDSKFRIGIAKVGGWIPISDRDDYFEEQLDARCEEKEKLLNDKAVKEAEARHNKIRLEIKERQEQLLDPKQDPYADLNGLDYYTMTTVTKLHLEKYVREQKQKVKDFEAKLAGVVEKLDNLDEKHPKYVDQWVERYNEKRRESGLKDFVLGNEL